MVILRFFVATLVVMAVLFIAAGKLDWWESWAYVIQAFVVLIFSRAFLIRKNPDLAHERAAAGSKEDVKPWDRILMPLTSIALPYSRRRRHPPSRHSHRPRRPDAAGGTAQLP